MHDLIEIEDEPAQSNAATDRDLTFALGQWDRFMFEEMLAEESEPLGDAPTRYPGTEWSRFVREVFARLYGTRPQKLDPAPLGAEWAAPLHDVLDGLPEWAQLLDECKGDADLAAVCAATVTNEVAMPDGGPPLDPTQAADDAAKAGAEGDEENAELAHAEMMDSLTASQTQAANLDKADERGEVRRALRAAVRETLDEAREVKQAIGMFGCGSEASAKERIEWAQRVRANPDLAKIAQLAGRMEATLQAERAEVPDDGREDMVGVKLGRSIGDALAMERALFSHPVLGVLQIAKLAEGRLLSHHQVGMATEEKAGRGPLIFALDESGSMEGEPNLVAKAIALTLARRCADEGRTFAFVHFDTRCEMSVYPKGAGFGGRILSDLECFLGGGTSIMNALATCASTVRFEQPEMPREDAERADVILVTDAVDYEVRGIEEQAHELSELGARLWTFHVTQYATQANAALREASTRYVQVGRAEVESGSGAATLALAIHDSGASLVRAGAQHEQ